MKFFLVPLATFFIMNPLFGQSYSQFEKELRELETSEEKAIEQVETLTENLNQVGEERTITDTIITKSAAPKRENEPFTDNFIPLSTIEKPRRIRSR